MRPIEVSTDRLDAFTTAALRAAEQVSEASASVVSARSSAGWAARRSGGRAQDAAVLEVQDALAQLIDVRTRVIEALTSMALVSRLAARCYTATEQTIDQAMGALLLVPGLFSPGPGGQGATGAVRSGDRWPASGWTAPVESLLDSLDPTALEALLVASPTLARVVTHLTPAAGSSAADLAATLRRAALLGPAPAASLVSGFLATLPAASRRRVALLHPRLMTAAAAAPVEDRFAACRVLVSADLAAQRAQRLERPHDAGVRDRTGRRISWEQDLLHGSVELEHPDGTVSRRPHQLLRFDPSGDGQIIEVLGDLRHADHVTVFVPGTGSDLDRYPGTFSRMVPFAAADPSLAVVVWQGADHPDQPFDDRLPPIAPEVLHGLEHPEQVPERLAGYAREHVLGAAFRDSADLAGPALARDVQGLRAAAPGPTSDLTVIGHSYGGSIVGSAELHGMTATRVVHVASAGAYVDDVTSYPPSAAGTRRFSMTAYDDPIRFAQGHDTRDAGRLTRSVLPSVLDPLSVLVEPVAHLPRSAAVGHGADPDLLPGVVRLDTGVHQDGSLVQGHSGMFAPGSTAWRNLLAVMTDGEVEVLETDRWAGHLQTARPPVLVPGRGHLDVLPGRLPRYVVDRSPYGDRHYRPPTLDLDDPDGS